MTNPDDRELDQYLKGDSALSRRYREASAEASPPDLDEAILARARAELRRKPSVSRVLAPMAVAASLALGVNVAWNVYQAKPAPEFAPEPPAATPSLETPDAPAAAPVEPQPERKARADRDKAEEREVFARQVEAQRRALKTQDPAGDAAPVVDSAPAAAAARNDAAPLTEAQKIDWLIGYVARLDGAAFMRKGKEYGPAEAAKHLQYKRERSGERIKTADDFIRLCAAHSYLWGEGYLIRLKDGRTRAAEDVLREQLARISAAG